jgi:aldose 1-epimerase
VLHVEPAGRAPDGTALHRVTLGGDGDGGPVVELTTHGAAVRGVEAPDATGRRGPVHLPWPTDPWDRAANPYLGATVGRWANRLRGARAVVDGREVQLSANESPNLLHGGPEGFDRRVWEVLEQVDDGASGGRVTFGLVSPDGDQGFPGTLRATVTYALVGDTLTIVHRATTDSPTVVNLTNHAYWHLGGGGPSVDDHVLAVAAAAVLPVDDALLPVGAPVPVAGTPLDLRRPTRLGRVVGSLPGGIDHCFALDGADPSRPTDEVRTAAVLACPGSGRWLRLRTDQPGLQVYTGGAPGPGPGRRGAVCLEAQRFPDAPNRGDLGVAVLRPGEEYRNVVELRFGVGDPPWPARPLDPPDPRGR